MLMKRKINTSEVFKVSEFYLQVLLSIPCVLVTPKRKLAGRLAVMRNALHFFSEFLVEGTGGSSVFKHLNKFSGTDSAKDDQLLGSRKQKMQKGAPNLDLGLGKDISNAVTDLGIILQNQCKKIKRHRRWNICKVTYLRRVYNLTFINLIYMYCNFRYFWWLAGQSCPLE